MRKNEREIPCDAFNKWLHSMYNKVGVGMYG
jgi:hypothetical protein